MASSVETTLQMLMTMLLRGDFDERLPAQDVLAKQFRVSRTVLREAISKLEYSNIVKVAPKTGTTVMPRSAWHLVNPRVVEWSYQEQTMSGIALNEALALIRSVGPDAAREVRQRVMFKENLHQFRMPASSAPEDLAEFHSSIFSQSGNSLYAKLAPIVKTFFLVASDSLMVDGEIDLQWHLDLYRAITRVNYNSLDRPQLEEAYWSLYEAMAYGKSLKPIQIIKE